MVVQPNAQNVLLKLSAANRQSFDGSSGDGSRPYHVPTFQHMIQDASITYPWPGSPADLYSNDRKLAVPFQWEAAPGRPKVQVEKLSSVYPLRPPPRLRLSGNSFPAPGAAPPCRHHSVPAKLKDFLLGIMPGANNPSSYTYMPLEKSTAYDEMHSTAVEIGDFSDNFDGSSSESETDSVSYDVTPQRFTMSERQSFRNSVDGLPDQSLLGKRYVSLEDEDVSSYDTASSGCNKPAPWQERPIKPEFMLEATVASTSNSYQVAREATRPINDACTAVGHSNCVQRPKMKLRDVLLQKNFCESPQFSSRSYQSYSEDQKLTDSLHSQLMILSRKSASRKAPRFQKLLEKAEALINEAEVFVRDLETLIIRSSKYILGGKRHPVLGKESSFVPFDLNAEIRKPELRFETANGKVDFRSHHALSQRLKSFFKNSSLCGSSYNHPHRKGLPSTVHDL